MSNTENSDPIYHHEWNHLLLILLDQLKDIFKSHNQLSNTQFSIILKSSTKKSIADKFPNHIHISTCLQKLTRVHPSILLDLVTETVKSDSIQPLILSQIVSIIIGCLLLEEILVLYIPTEMNSLHELTNHRKYLLMKLATLKKQSVSKIKLVMACIEAHKNILKLKDVPSFLEESKEQKEDEEEDEFVVLDASSVQLTPTDSPISSTKVPPPPTSSPVMYAGGMNGKDLELLPSWSLEDDFTL